MWVEIAGGIFFLINDTCSLRKGTGVRLNINITFLFAPMINLRHTFYLWIPVFRFLFFFFFSRSLLYGAVAARDFVYLTNSLSLSLVHRPTCYWHLADIHPNAITGAVMYFQRALSILYFIAESVRHLTLCRSMQMGGRRRVKISK